MPGLALPPFPDNLPTHPLLVIDYELIKAGDEQECNKLWKAATGLGFWYLKNHGADHEVEEMFNVGAETMDLPLEDKMKFEQGDSGRTSGYKARGTTATDEKGTADNAEFINISKDDALALPASIHSTYPPTVTARMESTIKPFVRKSVDLNNTIIGIFEKKLGLPAGALLKYHLDSEPSGSEARVIKSPPRPADELALDPEKVALRAHTDFGSLSFLHNRLGGLQVLPPGSTRWQYVRPLPGHAICNVGDALTVFSGGLLHSNMHRVVPPPGVQAAYDRWSLVFFTRPGDGVPLRALVDESMAIKEAVDTKSAEERAKYFPDSTAGEWFLRRVKYTRLKNMTSPEIWKNAQGMEHVPA